MRPISLSAASHAAVLNPRERTGRVGSEGLPVETYAGTSSGQTAVLPRVEPRVAVEKPVPARPPEPNETERFWEACAGQALQALTRPGALEYADQSWLDRLQSALGRDYCVIPDPDDPSREKVLVTRLTVEKLNASPQKREALVHALGAMQEASQTPPLDLTVGGESIPVHNRQIGERLADHYTSSSFRQLFDFCDQHGVFGIKVDPATGLIRTSGGAENAEMAARQWVTDTVRCGEIERDRDPQGWKTALSTLARFYAGEPQVAAFEKAIRDPESYRSGGPEEGVPHIFIPATLERDPNWFNNKRLESLGLALKAFCDTTVDGLVRGNPSGFSSPAEVSPEMVATVARIARMFQAIDYPTAPSVGNWEEAPIPGGLTWDTEAARAGLESLCDLMHNPAYDGNPGIAAVRERLREAPHGDFLSDREALEKAIQAGQDRIRRTYLAESPGIREMDASLAFLAQSSVRLDDNPVADVGKHLEMLETAERNLVRGNGMIRYLPFNLPLRDGSVVSSPDSYLSQNYTVAVDRDGKLNLEWGEVMKEFGSKDASDPKVFAARAALSSPNKEAEWFMVSDLAHGYAEQINKLLDHLGGRPPEAAERQLLERARAGAERSINRAYARITGTREDCSPRVKANGRECPALAVPEAYAHVTSLRQGAVSPPGGYPLAGAGRGGAADGERSTRPIAGENTPLMWATSSLYAASKELARALERLGG